MAVTPEAERVSAQIAAANEAKAKREQPRRVLVDLWVCPNPLCGNYFGASGAPNLSTQWVNFRGPNGEPQPHCAHTRAQCPDCRGGGDETERVRIEVWVDIPNPVPTPPRPDRF